MEKKNKVWITKDQLDTPLNELQYGIDSSMSTRMFVRLMEKVLGYPHKDLEELSYEGMNGYIDGLALEVFMRSKKERVIH